MVQSSSTFEPEHIASLPVPRLEKRLERAIHDLIERAAELRVKATGENIGCPN